ncbi:MAG: hypothetical protein A2X49_03660 [Lentisphaerae bacterium GWF2_52_8]|nr:MAG: hypothetical protein A2X49_03660 [Lentisphaerae bacterium GWF2_52_8]
MSETNLALSSLQRLGMPNFCFTTLCTSGYISYTSGLYLNLKRFYPDIPLVICGLDEKTRDFFNKVGDPLLITVSGNEIWGEDCWKNLSCRMKPDERAFASKSAISVWLLEHGYKQMLFLDSDTYLLDRIDDVIQMLLKHDILIIPSRFTLENWRKARVGNFNAGIFGFASPALQVAQVFKALCFDRCLNFQLDNLFFEQKFFDLFVHYNRTGIIRDLGINVQGSDFNELKPQQKEDGNWYVADGTKIRLFHATTPTPRDFPLVKEKLAFDREAKAKLSGTDISLSQNRVEMKKKLRITAFVKRIGIKWLAGKFWKGYIRAVKAFQDLNRVVSLTEEFSLLTRIRETYFHKAKLLAKLQDCHKKKQ